jgi:hypothetical protein
LIVVAGDFDDAEFAMLFFVRPIDRSPKDRIIPDASMEFLSDPARCWPGGNGNSNGFPLTGPLCSVLA